METYNGHKKWPFISHLFHLASFWGSSTHRYFIPSYGQIVSHRRDRPRFILSAADGPSVCGGGAVSCFLASMNNAIVNTAEADTDGGAGSHSKLILTVLRNCFPKSLYHFIFLPAKNEKIPTPLPPANHLALSNFFCL